MGKCDNKNELLTSLVLRLQAYHLPRRGVRMILPDTYAVVTSVSGPTHSTGICDSQEHVIGRTEIVPSSCQPQWTTTIPLLYELGSTCFFRIRLFRVVCTNGIEEHGENLGSGIFKVGDILGPRNRTNFRRLPNGGIILCRLEQNNAIHQDHTIRFRFAADLTVERSRLRPLPRFATAPDTIVEISKQHPSSKGWVLIYRSSPVGNSWTPKWDEGQLNLDSFCYGDRDQPLRIAVLQHHKKAQNQVLAECETTLRMILKTQLLDSHSTHSSDEASTMGFPLYDPTSQERVVGRLQVPLAEETQISDRTWHRHNRAASPKLVPQDTPCSREIVTSVRYHRPTSAEDVDQCQECVQKNPNPPRQPHHHHPLKPIPIPGQPTEFQRGIQLHMTLLLHAATCTSPTCSSANCTKMKGLLHHGTECHQQATGGCHVCQRIGALLQIHVRQCTTTSCPVPNCRAIRDHAQELEKQQPLAMDNRCRRQEEVKRVNRTVGRYHPPILVNAQ